MIDGDEIPVLFEWPPGRLKRWLVALGTIATLMLAFYLIFSWLCLETGSRLALGKDIAVRCDSLLSNHTVV